MITVKEQILRRFKAGQLREASAGVVAEIIGRPIPSTRRTLNQLVGEGDLKRTEEGEFKLIKGGVLAVCPRCEETAAYSQEEVQALFGYRTTGGQKKKNGKKPKRRRQSWCRKCRASTGR